MRRPSRHNGVDENAIQSKVGQPLCPESCPMWGNPSGEALTGVGIGQALSFERSQTGVPTVFLYTEGKTGSNANDKELSGPAESKTLCMCQYTLCRKPGGPNGI